MRIYYYERFSVNSPRRAEGQQITAKDAETAVTELKERFGGDLQFVYDEDFQTVYDRLEDLAIHPN